MAFRGAPLSARWRNTIMGLTPLVALALFFVTRSWMWFLWVPVVGVALYGTGRDGG